ncbi:MAG: hypothetical protein NC321_03405 [Clostridium sp.]|nr:hypothetical protein [Clostridium sp.]
MKKRRNNYILYGAASIGDIAKTSLEKCGLNVIGYIDKRAYELSEFNGLPVWKVNTVPIKYKNPQTRIYISVKNVFEHERIALLLREHGFYNIIYKPYNVLLGHGTKEENSLADFYDKLFNGSYIENFDFPDIYTKRSLYDYGFICEKNDNITAYIPKEFIFTNNYQDSNMIKWGNINISSFFTHIDFFQFLNNVKEAEPYNYLQEYCIYTATLENKIEITNAWKNNVIENRSQIYEQMKVASDLDPNFFIRNPAEAKWNVDKKYFNLLSGKHRCTFQAAIGKNYIPLQISKNDYAQFCHSSEIEKTMEIMEQTREELTIPHPFFYRGILIRDKGENHLLSWFANYFGRKLFWETGEIRFDKLLIIDYTNDFGNFSRFCKRLGCHVERRIQASALEQQLNRLLYAEDINYVLESKIVENAIIIFEANDNKVMELLNDIHLISNNNKWIIKYASDSFVSDFAISKSLQIVSEINRKYSNGCILKSYFLAQQ